MAKRKRKAIDYQTFIRTWETADNAEHVAKALGVTKISVQMRATKYRKLGIDLRRCQEELRGRGWMLRG